MSFLSPYNNPKLMLLSDRAAFPWVTLEKLEYESPLTGEVYTVPKYFMTDLASIPKALLLVPVAGPALFQRYFGTGMWQGAREAILHDYLRRKQKDGTTPVPAYTAHKVFREALYDGLYPPDLCETYYSAVVAFNS